MSNRLQSRKFLSAAFLMGVATVAMFMGMADFSQWAGFSQFVVGIYTSANVIGHFSNSEDSVDVDPELDGELAEYNPN